MKSILLIGMGRLGRHIARELYRLGHEVMAVDLQEERINEALPYVTGAQIGDSTNESFLKTLGVESFDVCIVTIGEHFQNSLETASLLKELGARKVISRAAWDVQEKFLLRNGADEVLYPEKQLARWAAVRYSADHVLDYMELDGTHSIVEVLVPMPWAGKSIGELDIRRKYNINILGVKENRRINASVNPQTVLVKGQSMLVLGEYRALQKCFRIS